MKHFKIIFIICILSTVLASCLYGCKVQNNIDPTNIVSTNNNSPNISPGSVCFVPHDFTGEWHRTNVPESEKATIKLTNQLWESKNKQISYQLTVYSADLPDPDSPEGYLGDTTASIINWNTIESRVHDFPDDSIVTILTLELSDGILTATIRTETPTGKTEGGSEEALGLIHTTIVGEYTLVDPVYIPSP